MSTNAHQVFKELDENKWRPFYLISGEEPFQTSEIIDRVKSHFLKGDQALSFSFEAFDGETADAGALVESLQTLPGLFEEASTRLIFCSRIDKLSAADFETLDSYFKDPNPSTCFLMTAAKVDKRKGWVKAVEAKGALIEVAEPFERDWPRWRGYFEKRSGKKISEEAWMRLVEGNNFSLSLVWSELQKLVVYVAEKKDVSLAAVKALETSGAAADVFEFTEDVVCKRKKAAVEKYQNLLKSGENEIKLLSLLVRHFRQVENCLDLMAKGVVDSKIAATQIGVPPFFVPKIQGQAKGHTKDGLKQTFHLLAETDFHLKIGKGSLFERFLVPYFEQN